MAWRVWTVLQRGFFRRDRDDRDLEEELRFHLERETELRVDRGATPEEARRAAALALGSLTLAQEETRAVWVSTRLEQWLPDLRAGTPDVAHRSDSSPEIRIGFITAPRRVGQAAGGRNRRVVSVVFCQSRMPQYVIEREMPGAGRMTESEVHAVSLRSLEVLKGMGPQIQWLYSYVTDEKIYCVYLAPDESAIRQHARDLGVPASRIAAVRHMIDPQKYQ